MVHPGGAVATLPGAVVLLVVVSLIGSGAATGLLEGSGEPERNGVEDPLDAGQETSESSLPCPASVPVCLWDDEGAWIAWAQEAGLEEIVETTRSAMAPIDTRVAAPDEQEMYGSMDDEERRAAWLGWWLEAEQGNAPHPAWDAQSIMPGEGDGPEKILFGDAQQQQTVVESSGTEEEEEESKLGEAFGLRSLWRLIAHGEVLQAHPADDADAQALVTSSGVVYLPEPGAEPEWLLRLPCCLGDSQVSEPGSNGTRLLGIESGNRGIYLTFSGEGNFQIMPGSARGLRVVDLDAGALVYEGFTYQDEELARQWSFTDVNGDGNDDLLVITNSDELVAVDLSTGEEIYRNPLPEIVPDVIAQEVSVQLHGPPVFGDATGDGVQDLWVLHEVYASVEGEASLQAVYATVLSGKTGELHWQRPLDVEADAPRVAFARVTGDLDGDGQEDLLFSDSVPPVEGSTQSIVTGVSGADGALLMVDDARRNCPELSLCPPVYHPVAVVDLDGDGRGEIIGMQTLAGGFLSHPIEAILVRSLPEGGLWSEPVAQEEDVELRSMSFGFEEQMALWQEPGGPGGAFFALTLSRTEDGVERVYAVDQEGIHTIEPPEPLVHFSAHPQTGGLQGWILQNDHWAPLGDDLSRRADGFRLTLSTDPLVSHRLDGDHVPALLMEKTAGYQWISGRNGSHLRDVERPYGDYHEEIFVEDGEVYVLERRSGSETEYRFGPLEGEPDWVKSRDDLDGDRIEEVEDFTGDGQRELLVYEYGRTVYSDDFEGSVPEGSQGKKGRQESGVIEGGERVPPRWSVQSPVSGDSLWEFSPSNDDYRVTVEPVDGASAGPQSLLIAYNDGDSDHLVVRLHNLDEEDPVWEQEFAEDARLESIAHGRFIVQERGDEEEDEDEVELLVHRVSDGQQTTSIQIPVQDEHLWVRLDDLGERGPHLIHSYNAIESGAPTPSADSEPPIVEQFIAIRDADGARTAIVQTVDEGEAGYDEDEEYWDILRRYDYTRYSGSVGDWDGDDKADLILWEERHETVRSSASGKLLAVAPEGYYMGSINDDTRHVDLNGDGRKELGMRNSDVRSLTWQTYDPDANETAGEGSGGDGRIDLGEDANRTRDMEAFFDGPRDTPGPAFVVMLLVLSGLVVVIRRRR